MTINFVLCNASLELYRPSKKQKFLSKSFKLLNEDDHSRETVIQEESDSDSNDVDMHAVATGTPKKNWKEVRPDILHFCLMALQDSILNKQRKIQIWVKTLNGLSYRISPDFRIPRTWKVFNKVFANYLHSNARNLYSDDQDVILVERVDSIDKFMPPESIKIGISQKGIKCSLDDLITTSLSRDLDKSWFYLSISPFRDFDCPDVSGIIKVANIYSNVLQRFYNTPKDPNYSQKVEDDPAIVGCNIRNGDIFQHTIMISRNTSAMYNCHKAVSAIETFLNL
ncbi:bifunctional Alpha-beta knot methyltransferases/Ribosomal biogenesis [Babesia duncani]|uniref:Bifunctional Alpha-beta knot methyltransferases/Ribosomal biogenesis n=1 Tax=Babesia duncani TaxID=323732 RepID=A0AAD9PJN6_9APIC|nr:bifunctional Alpha-beta knot methyltransferases/Ribosomal biogenesis [Babesia duncani]